MPTLRLPFMLLLTLICVCPSTAFAQQETATITGSVKDPSGAIVPGATSVIAESTGFAKTIRTGVTLQVAQRASI